MTVLIFILGSCDRSGGVCTRHLCACVEVWKTFQSDEELALCLAMVTAGKHLYSSCVFLLSTVLM